MADKPFEISVEDYGAALFGVMNEKYKDMPDHWKAIAKEAKPLVEQLIALNDKMPKPYLIKGLRNKSGKRLLTPRERIRETQKVLWKVKASTLKEGDRVWLLPSYSDYDMEIGAADPVLVVDISKKCVYVEIQAMNYEYNKAVNFEDEVLKAPDDFDPHGDDAKYLSDEFWLEQADKLGI